MDHEATRKGETWHVHAYRATLCHAQLVSRVTLRLELKCPKPTPPSTRVREICLCHHHALYSYVILSIYLLPLPSSSSCQHHLSLLLLLFSPRREKISNEVKCCKRLIPKTIITAGWRGGSRLFACTVYVSTERPNVFFFSMSNNCFASVFLFYCVKLPSMLLSAFFASMLCFSRATNTSRLWRPWLFSFFSTVFSYLVGFLSFMVDVCVASSQARDGGGGLLSLPHIV